MRHPVVGPLSRRLARRADLVAAVSRALFGPEDGRPGLPPVPGAAVLPCGPDLRRFRRMARGEARRELGLDPAGATCSSPPTRRAPRSGPTGRASWRDACGAELLTGGAIEPERMPLWVNAANAVLVTSDYEGFGLVCVEALACDVPVLSTPVGIAPFALEGHRRHPLRALRRGALGEAARPHLDAPDPRIEGAARAASLSAARMAERVVVAYREVLDAAPIAPRVQVID